MDTAAPAPHRSRKGLYIPLLVLAVACLGWAGFWSYAKSRALDVMDVWLAREARLGRTWTCPERVVGGFPFRFEVSCTAPTFASAEPGRAGTGSLGGLTVTARVVDPRQIIAAASGPLKWTSAVGDSLEIAFDSARASYRGSANALEELSVDLANPLATYTAPGLFTEKLAAARTEFHMRRAPGEEPATDLALQSTAVKSGLVDQLTGDTAPGRIDVRMRLSKLLPSPPRDWRETLELWRIAGGEARIEKLALAKGPIVIEATGALRLDEFRRPDGEISGTAQGLQQILQAFGLGGGGGGLLGSILSGGRPQAAQPARALPFSLRFAEGRLFIGPIPGPRLRPLF